MAKSGRPKVEIDLELAKKLAGIQCTIKEISAVMGIPASTLQERSDFRLAYENGLENGKASLRRIQFKMAERSAAMAIWLGKQYLGQFEKQQISDDSELIGQELVFDTPKNNEGTHRFKEFLPNEAN